MPSLPLTQEQLENFILHHVHLWTKEYAFANPDDTQSFARMMEMEFSSFYVQMADKFRNEVLPKFEEAA